jgi:hypothetical protein
MFDADKLECINVVPDIIAYAQQAYGKGVKSYDVFDALLESKAFDNMYISKIFDVRRIRSLELLALVPCDPFNYTDTDRHVHSHRVLFFKGQPVCLITNHDTSNEKALNNIHARWASRHYYNIVLEELLKYRREVDIVLTLCSYTQQGVSHDYEKAFVLLQGEIWMRINYAADGVYENVLLERCDNLRRYVRKLTLTNESAALVGQTNLDDENLLIEDFTHTRKDFDDDFVFYRKVETNGLLPFHVDEMRFK